ncbi:MAG: hypothetical protein ACK456_11890, partial [Pseudanabaenaceae cyanobacterium]
MTETSLQQSHQRQDTIRDIIQDQIQYQIEDQIILGDCLEVLKQLPNNSVNLIMTSPPYADSRRSTYGGVHPDQYVEW